MAERSDDRPPASPDRPPRRPSPTPARDSAKAASSGAAASSEPATPQPGQRSPLTDRWWWTGGSLALVGVVVIAWQWSSISTGAAFWGTWVVAALGAVAVAVGASWVWRDRPRRTDGED